MTHLTYSASSGNFGRFLLKPNTQDCVRCPPSLLMSYGGHTEVLVRIPRLLLRRALCHGGKRFCLSVGQFRVSGFKPLRTFAFFAAKKLTHFPTLQAGDGNFTTAAYVKDHAPRIAFLETRRIIALPVSESNQKENPGALRFYSCQ